MNVHQVSIVFTSRSANGDQPVRSVRRSGQIAEGADGFYLLFQDTVEEAGTVDYSIKFGNREALIRRKGALPLRQPLALGVSMEGSYQSPFGTLPTEAVARRIEADWDAAKGQGRATLSYELTMQQEPAGNFEMIFSFSRLRG